MIKIEYNEFKIYTIVSENVENAQRSGNRSNELMPVMNAGKDKCVLQLTSQFTYPSDFGCTVVSLISSDLSLSVLLIVE